MPTGYTADIEKGISFKTFALGCARAFGALVTMREDPSDAPIPDVFEPSSYYEENIGKAKNSLKRLDNMTDEQCEAAAEREYKKEIKDCDDAIKKNKELRVRYQEMLAKAEAYVAPSPDHVQYRSFMIEQLESSLEHDCLDEIYYKEKKNLKVLSGKAWLAKEIKRVQSDIEYYTIEYSKEIARCKSRTKWVTLLKESLKNED